MNQVSESLNDISRLRDEMHGVAMSMKQARSLRQKDDARRHRFVENVKDKVEQLQENMQRLKEHSIQHKIDSSFHV